MSGSGAPRKIKAKIITHANDSDGTPWKVRLNPENLDRTHPGNVDWFLEFDSSAVAAGPVLPGPESDLERSTFELDETKDVKEYHDGDPPQQMTVAQFFSNGAKYQPGAYNSVKGNDPNGNIGDPTSRSAIC